MTAFFRKVLLLSVSLLCFTQNLFAYPAEVENIPPSEYLDVALQEIASAESSIDLCMYLISFYPEQPGSAVAKLLDALVQAKEKGVRVKVILDLGTEDPNRAAFNFLRKNGIPVFYDTLPIYTHAKTLVIDGRTVIIGSTNWSRAALTQNNEAAVLIRSKPLADDFLRQFAGIDLSGAPALSQNGIPMPVSFLTDTRLLSRMVSSSDERAFDVYLYLVKKSSELKSLKFELDLDALADELRMKSLMDRESYRRQLIKTLSKLEDRYSLIKADILFNQNAMVELIQTDKSAFILDDHFWKYGWHRSLSFPAKAMILIIASNTQTSPAWFMSREDISKKYGFSNDVITAGITELRRLNLLEVVYGAMSAPDFSERPANIYTLKPFYDPTTLAAELESIQKSHGPAQLTRAVSIASIVYEENNPRILKTLIELESSYGESTLAQAATKIAEKKPDNPKRSAGYLINTIKSMGGDSQ